MYLCLLFIDCSLENDIFYTIKRPAEGIFKDKGSKFLAFAFPIESEQDFKDHLARLKKQYFDARHHCYAFAIGLNRDINRSGDDGEPSGTAGKPIYNQLLSSNLTNIAVIVVRYFGGTLLGTSGLIQAYKGAAADAITNAEVIEKHVQAKLNLSFEYELLNQVLKIVKGEGADILNQHYDNTCMLETSIRASKLELLSNKLEKIPGVRIES